MKRLTMTALLLLCGTAFAVTPKAENVTISGVDSREVTITYTLTAAPVVVTLDIETNTASGARVSIGGEHIQRVSGDVNRQVSGKDTYTISWLPDRDWPGNLVESGRARAVVTAWPLDNTPDYLVVNLLTTTNLPTARYYTSTNFLPGGLLSNPAYRTSSIVMRKILAKDVTWTMGSVIEAGRQASEVPHAVTLTNNYYIGVFEMTQRQWALVCGAYNANNFTYEQDHAMRLVEKVCYNQIRNSGSTTANEGYEWPAEPYANSVLGKLRKKTGIDFDLPSDAEWEFACRAGNGEGLWNDGSAYINSSSDSHLDRLSRNKRNVGSPSESSDASAGTAIVGSYAPNSWGLYDMHGNVGEWCLDWYKEDLSGTDGSVVTVKTENSRVRRSGLANDNIYRLRSAARAPNVPTLQNLYIGLRLACRAGL